MLCFLSWLNKAKCSFAKPYDSPMGWFPMLITLMSVFCLYATCYYVSATLLLLILLGTTVLVIRENNLRRTEIHRKTQTILEEISLAKILCKDWTAENYPNLCCPLSPCVTLQWTYRDGIIVNLPWALLVRGQFNRLTNIVFPRFIPKINRSRRSHYHPTGSSGAGTMHGNKQSSYISVWRNLWTVSAHGSAIKTNCQSSVTRSRVCIGNDTVLRHFKDVLHIISKKACDYLQSTEMFGTFC